MKRLKVFGGLTFVNGKQVRTIIATYTKKRAAELLEVNMYEFSNFWCETGNEIEVKTALEKPETIFKSSGIGKKDFKETNNE